MTHQPSLFPQEQTERTSDDFYTPKWVFDALGLTFEIDVASPPDGPLFTPCRRYFTQADDGLAQPWEGLVWMNPPYSKPAPWVARWSEHGNGVALLPFTRGRWNATLWATGAKCALPKDGMKFHVPNQKRLLDSGPFMNLIWAIGDEAIEALKASEIGAVR